MKILQSLIHISLASQFALIDGDIVNGGSSLLQYFNNFRDKENGGSCQFDSATGLPDANCVFVIVMDDNDEVQSSYMSVQFLPNVSNLQCCVVSILI